jgi:hypothetical protein
MTSYLRTHLEYCFSHTNENKVTVYKTNNMQFFVFEYGVIYMYTEHDGYSQVDDISNILDMTHDEFMKEAFSTENEKKNKKMQRMLKKSYK